MCKHRAANNGADIAARNVNSIRLKTRSEETEAVSGRDVSRETRVKREAWRATAGIQNVPTLSLTAVCFRLDRKSIANQHRFRRRLSQRARVAGSYKIFFLITCKPNGPYLHLEVVKLNLQTRLERWELVDAKMQSQWLTIFHRLIINVIHKFVAR